MDADTNFKNQQVGKGVDLAKQISVAQFLEANRQMLGFSSLARNILITVKQSVDNALDAAEDQLILVDLKLRLQLVSRQVYRYTITDNGPGIPKQKIGRVFGSLLYGSKFHEKRQKRGQQGLGISACILNSQIDLNKPAKVTSKTKELQYANYQEIKIDVTKNKPIITGYKKLKVPYEHGVSIDMFIKGTYISEGKRSVTYYLQQVSLMNPWANIQFEDPSGNIHVYKRSANEIKNPSLAKIYPKSIPLGVFDRLLKQSANNLDEFLQTQVEGMNSVIINNILENTGIPGEIRSNALTRYETNRIHEQLKYYQYPINEQTISVVGEQQLLKSLRSQQYDFAVSTSSGVLNILNTVVRFETALVYGGNLLRDQKMEICRFVNKVPLLLQPGSCLLHTAISKINWKSYGLVQTKGELPVGPIKLVTHLAGYQIPFNSEAKQSVAELPALEKVYIKTLKKLGILLNRQLSKQRFIIAQKQKLRDIQIHMPQLYRTLSNMGYPVYNNLPILYSKIMNGLVWQKTAENKLKLANYTGIDYNLEFEDTSNVTISSNTYIQLEYKPFYTKAFSYQLDKAVDWGMEYTADNYESKISELPFVDTSMLDKLTRLVKDISEQLNHGQVPSLAVRVRTKQNLILSEQGYWTLSKNYGYRTAKKVVGIIQIIRILKLTDLFSEQIIKKNTSSLRQIYYVSETWGSSYKFNEQAESDGFIQYIEVLTGLSREFLGVFPEARGQLAGPILMQQKTKKGVKLIDCLQDLPDKGGGILIPFSSEQMRITSCTADFTLAIETSGTFNRLVEDGFHTRYNCNLVCTNGQPTRSTRQVLKLLANKPVLAFFDCDNWSYRIFGSCAYGSIKTAHLSSKLCIPSLIHLGLTYDDILEYNLPTDKLKNIDVQGFKQLLQDPRYFPSVWADVLNRQMLAKVKAQQQSLASLGLLFVSRTYLPKKLHQLGIIKSI